jgi:membrane fusion protein, heavy metal efflux system
MKILISITLLGLALFGGQIIEISQKQQEDLGVKTQVVTRVNTIVFGPYNGTVVLDKKDVISVSSNVESIVKNIYVRELEYVKLGQKLITLKSNVLLNLQQQYLEAILESQNENQNYERNIKLQADGIIPNKKLLESKKLKQSSDLSVKLTANQLLTNGFTQKMLKEIQQNNKPIVEKTIYASRDGIVTNVNVNIGEYVLGEHKMIEIYADGKRFIELTIPVRIVKDISIGDICNFPPYLARVTAIGNVVNSVSQSVIVRATIEDAKDIMINRIYEVNIAKKVSDAVKIKKSALVFEENKSYVFKKVPKGFEVLNVEIVSEGPVCYTIKADFKDGDEVAASSTSALLGAKESQGE